TDCRRRPFADAVHRQDRGPVERRGKEGTGRMRLMVLCKKYGGLEVCSELLANHASDVRLLAQPRRNTSEEGLKASWRNGQVRFQQPLCFDQRLLVKNYSVQLPDFQSAGPKAE